MKSLLIALLLVLISSPAFTQETVKLIKISPDSLNDQELQSDDEDSLVNPKELQPLEPKRCDVIVTKAVAYIANPVDLNPDRSIFDIPSQYDGKVVKKNDDFEVYFPRKMYLGLELVLSLASGSGTVLNYNDVFEKVPIDILEEYDVQVLKSSYKTSRCYLEVKQQGSWKRIYGADRANNSLRLSDMEFGVVDDGKYYDVNVYSFDKSGQKLDQSYKVLLKYCSVTDSRRCP